MTKLSRTRTRRKHGTGRKIILRNMQSPGDVLMLTAALRDLHKSHPNRFITDVRTSCPELWENNPYLNRLEETDADTWVMTCDYPLIHHCNELPYHFIHGFRINLEEQLNISITPHAFAGDIHLSDYEIDNKPAILRDLGGSRQHWILVAGGKYDYTAKWWLHSRWQEVVARLKDRVVFLQVGESNHYHPAVEGAIDLRGQTSLRDIISLVNHTHGVLSPVTFLMHLAACLPLSSGRFRPCVVIAGGREPPHWEAYPGHQFLHTVGALPCCATGGCWKSRILPLGDGDPKDHDICDNLVDGAQKCMQLIDVETVIRAIEMYLT